MDLRRPRVTAAFAQSLDGKIAFHKGRTNISSAVGHKRAHVLRSTHDAIVVGVGTVRSDNPQLTVRHGIQPTKDLLRVVLSSTLEVPSDARILEATNSLVIVGTRERATPESAERLQRQGVEHWHVPQCSTQRVDLKKLAPLLREKRGIESVLVEGGSTVLTSFFNSELVDRVEIEVAPSLFGDHGTPSVAVLSKRVRIENIESECIDGHHFIRGDVRYADS